MKLRVVPRGRGKVVALVLGVLVLVAGLVRLGVAWASDLPDGAVLRVGDVVVDEERFRRRVQVLQALYGVREPEEPGARENFRRDAAKSIAVSTILDQAAAGRGVVVGDKAVRDALGKLIDNQLEDGHEAFTRFLADQGLSEKDVLDEVKRQLVTSRLLEQVTADVRTPSAADVRKAYEDHRDRMVEPERRHLLNIVVDSEQKAKALRAEAGSGAGFRELAARRSLDGSTRDKGGDLGTLAAADLDPDFAKAAFATPPRTVFGPVKSQHGWNVGYVAGVEPEKPLPYEQVAARLKDELATKWELDAWRAWLGERIQGADVDYADAYLPEDPDAPPAEPPAPR